MGYFKNYYKFKTYLFYPIIEMRDSLSFFPLMVYSYHVLKQSGIVAQLFPNKRHQKIKRTTQ